MRVAGEIQPLAKAEDVGAAIIEKLALAVAKAGSDAMLIDQENRLMGRVSIREAAHSQKCFAVELADDVLALDADETEAAHWVGQVLVNRLERRGICIVLLNSGRPGHVHLFARIPDAGLKQEIESVARFFGCCGRVGQRIRPPLSPHRSDLPVSLILPATPADALKALARSRPLPPPLRKTRSFSGRMFALMRHGDRDGRYNSRSEVTQALALAAVNAELPEQFLLKVLLDPNNRGGEKIQELARTKGEREARRYVGRIYRNAVKRHAAQPPFRSRSDVIAKIDEIERAIDAAAARWKGRAGSTDRAVLRAHFRIIRRSGEFEHGAGVREVAPLAGINSLSTVSAAHGRLGRDGYLRCVKPAWRGRAARYVVDLPKSPSRTVPPMGGR